jgi:hypothetical protein
MWFDLTCICRAVEVLIHHAADRVRGEGLLKAARNACGFILETSEYNPVKTIARPNVLLQPA